MAPRGAAALLVVAMAVALVVTASAAKEVNNKGRLSLDFYRRSCPQAESVVRRFVAEAVRQDVGLLHDCFGAAGRVRHRPRRAAGPAQPDAPAHGLQGRQRPPRAPGPGLRRGHRRLLRRHPRARGPQVGRPTECLWAAATARPSPPTAHVPELLEVLSKKINLDMTDLVALSGGHTIGLAHCSEGLFTNPKTKSIVTKFAQNQKAFFHQFTVSMVKMGQINVLTGSQGQIRKNCSARNNPNNNLLLPPLSLHDALLDLF
ncbi:hypothetical protein PR202_gb03655 [Eleusine coracana subsp. coracana]|uniref:Plant heme peroxidase family profile domain-containing protein n=1 Tax=Eleusine coracana subsp. coracana TaxID=191504 RepID=A0AAV5E1P3_ELECO|nr:hypothetical protein PR202_gb03655 [Eleusine coracana subsp. coracana]